MQTILIIVIGILVLGWAMIGVDALRSSALNKPTWRWAIYILAVTGPLGVIFIIIGIMNYTTEMIKESNFAERISKKHDELAEWAKEK